MQAFADKLTNEMVADIKLPVPPAANNGLQCYYGTLLIPRDHLPQGHLRCNFMPLLIKPDETDATIVLPRRHWDDEFKQALR